MTQLGMATAMVRSTPHATGVAASGMSSINLGAKGKGRTSRLQRSSRRAALYCQIKSMLQQDQGVGSGDQSRKTNESQAIDQVDSRINAKQYKKVGYKDAKSWMERRLANIKAGVPNWAATDLASQWSKGLKCQELDATIAEIKAINLAKKYNQWHVPRFRSMSQQRPEGVFGILGGQLNSASSLDVRSRKTGDIIHLIKEWEIQGGVISEVGINSLLGKSCLVVQGGFSRYAHSHGTQQA
jgi:hypothetical protein